MSALIFATGNVHKAEEVILILKGSGVVLRTLADLPELDEPPETGDTFVHNALQKARYVYEKTGLPCIADDSGLVVDALDGAPGVHSKRFSPEGTAESNNALLLKRLRGVSDRAARFVCVLAYVSAQGEGVVEGRCEGRISSTLSAVRGGFGYDPVFCPDERAPLSMSELSMEEKSAISHRGRAFRQLTALIASVQRGENQEKSHKNRAY